MQVLRLRKPDGRNLVLYARDDAAPPSASGDVPVPHGARVEPRPHLRWHALRQEWVAYAAHRQDRTFLPPPEYNPLAPTRGEGPPTELPAGAYDVAVFENRFPTFTLQAPPPPDDLPLPVAPAVGVCEVVVFTQDPRASLGTLSTDHVALVIEVWAQRTLELGAREPIAYVLPFENRGVEMGVTLHHPHGQIYAYPFVPPLPAREHRAASEFHERHGRTLLAAMIEDEERDGRRMLVASERAVAFVPACARYPYESWIVPRRAVARLDELTAPERWELASALRTVVRAYDALWDAPMPYLLAVHQGPTVADAPPGIHLHVELSPARRARDRLKFLAGTELAAGTFANDSLPEAKAAELEAVIGRTDG